jgi:hypothetical protein
VRCHGTRKDAMNGLCLNCHQEVRWLVAQRRGYHAEVLRDPGTSCASCHPDHAGEDFAMIAWPGGAPEQFDHRRAGWALDGKHATVKCAECHRDDFRVSAARSLSPRKTAGGWTGLETTCASCHQSDDPHRGALGSRCDRCHDLAGWSPAPRFDHDSSRYPLTGKHADLACRQCHRPVAGQQAPVFRPLSFAECSSCHADPHQGRLSARCSSCHATRGFGQVARGEFNHGLTRYPLLGRHRAVSCEGCHGVNLATPRPASATCTACHADPHQGQATIAGKSADCAACHRVEGFSPSTFTVAQHATAPFTLTGRHVQVACAACHTRDSTGTRGAAAPVRLRLPFGGCDACHADPHGAQLAGIPGGGRCDRCHRSDGWQVDVLPAPAHAALGLPLDGGHEGVSCRACHGTVRPGLPALRATVAGRGGVVFALTSASCASCHRDPHAGRFAATGAHPVAGECAACHTSAAFTEVAVDSARHAALGFTLAGAHRAVACGSCHEGLAGSRVAGPAAATLLTAPAPAIGPSLAARDTTCAGCHTSLHGNQFGADRGGNRCDRCHDATAFAPAARFDHDRDAAFALRGAHAAVACDQCHRAGADHVVRYRPLSSRCESCHGARPAGGGR